MAEPGARPSRRRLAGLVAAPIPATALVVLIANDAWAKDRWGNWWTGKLSDVAGLVIAPLVGTWLASLALGDHRTPLACRRLLGTFVGAAVLGLVAVKTSSAAADAYEIAAGVVNWPGRLVRELLRSGAFAPYARGIVVVDPTDMVTLPAVALAWWWGKRTIGPDAEAPDPNGLPQ